MDVLEGEQAGQVTALVALLGGLFGLGAVTAVAAWRGVDVGQLRPRAPVVADDRVGRLGLRLAMGVGSGVMVAAVTRWPVAALAPAAGGFVLPGLVGRKADRRSRIEKVEAIAGWAEMLRDTMADRARRRAGRDVTVVVPPGVRRGSDQSQAGNGTP